MSHSPATAARYYQAVIGKKEAARAHALCAQLYKCVEEHVEQFEEEEDEGMHEEE